MIFNQIISVIAAAKGADNVCADLLGSFPQMKIPIWTAANNPAMGIKEGIKYPAESISRGATAENARGFNYVIFDEKAITIDKKINF